jgi:hypothetical protein
VTTDDLRAQKGLALLDAQETREAKRNAETEYGKRVQAIGGAYNALSGFYFEDVDSLRRKLKPFEFMVSVDKLAESLQQLVDARAAQKQAEQRLLVFGINPPTEI